MQSITITDTQDQTRDIFLSLADEDVKIVDHTRWHALQTWLVGAEHRVTIPFGPALAKMTKSTAVRLRRDFEAVLNLIRAHAILHQKTRDRDDDGKIVASLEDYGAVLELIAQTVAEGVDAVVPPAIRDTVEAVRTLVGANPDEGVTASAIGKVLEIDKSSALRRCRDANYRGYLKNLEDRKGRPGRYVLGDALPFDTEIFPTVERFGGCTVAGSTGGK